MFSVILLPLPVCSRDVTSRLSVSYWVTQMPISPCSGMCILIYHENGGRFNASFQEDRASISSQANQKSAGYHCILAVFFHYYYGRYLFFFFFFFFQIHYASAYWQKDRTFQFYTQVRIRGCAHLYTILLEVMLHDGKGCCC